MTNRQSNESGAPQTLTYAALAMLIFVWASNFSVVKYALRDFAPLAFNGLRFALASVLIWLIVKIGGRATAFDRRDWPALIGLGILGNTVYQILFVYGIDWTLAGNASLMLATTPIFTTLLSVAFRQERIGLSAWLGAILSFLGI
ncbi:MAG TPA: DMT family transporter, partial [Dehalococcoidia bacterium]